MTSSFDTDNRRQDLRRWPMGRGLSALVCTAVLSLGCTATTAAVPTPVAASATPAPSSATPAPSSVTGPCSKVLWWYINLGYNLLKFNGSWVLSSNVSSDIGTLSAFASVSLSVGGTSFNAVAHYYPSYAAGYVATYSGTLAGNCSIGLTNAPGTWSSNMGQSGTFTARPTFAPTTGSISGKVTGPSGGPVAGVVIEALAGAAVAGKSTTDGAGRYHITGLAPGPYSVEAATDQRFFSPSTTRVGVGSQPVTVNFTEACGASTPAGEPACPLEVFVKVLEPLRSGFAVHGEPYNEFPVDFVSSPSPGLFRCESGCVDIVVTATNPLTQKPVANAKVDVSVANMSHLTGDEYLCAATPDGRTFAGCGKYLPGLKTDDQGHLYLRYWAPGVDEPETTTFTALANCAEAPCPSGTRSASANLNLTVSPYLIYAHTSPLAEEDAAALAEWSGGTAVFTKFLHVTAAAPKVLGAALKWLEANEVAAETAVKGLEALEKVEPVFGVIEVFQAFTELWERESMISMFLENTKLSAIGLGEPAIEASAPGAPGTVFGNHLVNYGVVVPFNLGAAGAWWDIAATLRKLQVADEAHGKKPDLSSWSIGLKVYEVSSCDPSKGDCYPGYINDPGATDPLRPGIEPALEVSVSLLLSAYNRAHTARQLYNFDTHNFIIPYDALAWTETQAGLKGLVHDSA